MNHLFTTLLRKLVPCIGLMALFAVPTFAQNPQAEIKAPPVEAQLKPDQVAINRQPAIPFKPFNVIDPKTGQPTSRDTILSLPNGKKLTAGQYWDEINKLEQQLNAEGYTLRPSTGDRQGTPKKIELQQTPTPTMILQKQAQTLSSENMRNLRFQPLNIMQAEQAQRSMLVINQALLDSVRFRGTPNTLHWEKKWNRSFGDPSTFSASINAQVDLDGTSSSTSLDAEADAGGSLFSNSFDLLRLSGKLNAPQKGQMNVNLSASVLGQSVYSFNQSMDSTFTKSDSVSKTLDKNVTLHFSIAFVPVSVKLGVQGTAGLSYAVTVAPVKATGSLAPSIKTNAYAQAGVDLVVASGGVGGKLTILNVDGNLTGGISIAPGPNNSLNYNYNDSYCQTLDTLSGNLYAYVIIGDCDFFGLCKEFDHTFFSWTGFKSSGCLFNDSKTSPVYQPLNNTPRSSQ